MLFLRNSMSPSATVPTKSNTSTTRFGASALTNLFSATWPPTLPTFCLSPDSLYLTDWGHNQVMVAVYISVQQFDMDIGDGFPAGCAGPAERANS